MDNVGRCKRCGQTFRRTVQNTQFCTLECRFWSKVGAVGGGGCRDWRGGISNYGYGVFKTLGVRYLAHRVSWELTNGLIPEGLCVCHRCDRRICVEPFHLFLGTNQENTVDRDEKCRQARGGGNAGARIDAQAVLAIRQMIANGMSQRAVAAAFDLSQPHISRIVLRKNWSHL